MPVKPVESLKKGLELLEVLAAHAPSLKLQEITRLSGLPRATVYRLLQTLVAQGYVHYFPSTATFRLGPKVMSLGFSALSGFDLAEVAEPYLRELSQRIEQNVNLGILDGGDVVYIIRVKARRILGIDLAVGSRLSAHNSAIGRALLAYLDPGALEKVIGAMSQDPAAAASIGPQGRLLKQKLAQVRRLGYALSEDEFETGLCSVAVPVMGPGGQVEAAVNLPVFSQLCTRRELLEQYLPELVKTAGVISELRGRRPLSENQSQARAADRTRRTTRSQS